MANNVSPVTGLAVIGGKVYVNIPKGPVLQVGQVGTISGAANGASSAVNAYFNQAWTILQPVSGIIISQLGGAVGPNIYWDGFMATAIAVPNSPFTLATVGTAAAGNTTYTGTVTGYDASLFVGQQAIVTAFTNAANVGTFTVVSGSSTTLVLSNSSGAGETHAGTAAINVTILPVQLENQTGSAVNITNPTAIDTTVA